MSERCPFCHPDPGRVFYDGPLAYGLWDAFPVSPGHALLVTRRHVPTWFEASEAERRELISALETAKEAIEREHSPDGYNIGVNVGEAGGQTVGHLHVHLIPRYRGDVPDPRGGVRHIIPGKGNYLVGTGRAEKPLTSGGEDMLWEPLGRDLDRARDADIAVAFVMESGVSLVVEHLRDLLARGGKLRLLTGDYLGVTDPQALLALLDLEGRVELRVFESAGVSFHPKAYLLHFEDGTTTAYIGSSNLSRSALTTGVEWNYRVITSVDSAGIEEVKRAFEELFRHPATRAVTDEWVGRYRDRRDLSTLTGMESAPETPEPPPAPHQVQREALAALEETRRAGNAAGLVVLATGLGKTWLSAFDSDRPEFKRVLFVAHREEILAQAMKTFRRVRPYARFGKYTGTARDPRADVLFASVQTLGRLGHLRRFARDHFDYIVVDEFHHAAARTYRQMIDYFEPRFLLGLTATPERTDGGDLLALCGNNLVYRSDLFEGIGEGLLSPFSYFGVPDKIDYANIPWRSNRFDVEALTQVVATQARAQNVLEQYRQRAGRRTLAFCCSQRHADFMADFFGRHGVSAVAVHSGAGSAPRAGSLEALGRGELSVVFSVDMFNEGVDVPNVDTVMMLRPTESRIIWLQQLGRGLRKAEGKDRLTVIDYIGNHRAFLDKPRALFGLGAGDREIERALNLLAEGNAELPPGCEVTYDLEAVEILRGLLRAPSAGDAVEEYYRDFRDRLGERPTALETFQEGYITRSIRPRYGSWFGFVGEMGDLSEEERRALDAAGDFLGELDITSMSKSYKMVVLLAMISEGRFPGQINLAELAAGVKRIAEKSAPLKADFGDVLQDLTELRQMLVRNPIAAWCRSGYFEFKDGVFRSTIRIEEESREVVQGLTRELVDWRLAEYLRRPGARVQAEDRFICKVSHADGRPILFLPSRGQTPGLPSGRVRLFIDGEVYEGDFVKIALNVVRRPGESANELPNILRAWFGPDAGRSGTQFRVEIRRRGDGYLVAPYDDGADE